MTNYIKNNNKLKIILSHLNILYIEDEINIREKLKETLELIVSEVYDVDSIEKAENILSNKRVDIIISDVQLGKKNAIELIKNIRENYINTPVILLSAYTEKNYLLEATKLKLVDYLVKPIDFRTLYLALEKGAIEILNNGNYVVSFYNNTSYNVLNKKLLCKKDKKEIMLTAKEIALLDTLLKNSFRVISQEEIKNSIWEDTYEVSDSALKNLINKLRKKIGKNTILNTSGVGYKIKLL